MADLAVLAQRPEGASDDECWLWNHARTSKGYGQKYRDGKVRYVHRLVWEEHYGVRLGCDDVVRHSCDNPPCYNPRHLVVGTQRDNIQDCFDRGRARRARKVSPEVAAKIVERYFAGERSKDLAVEYGLHQNYVSYLARLVDADKTRARHGRGRWK